MINLKKQDPVADAVKDILQQEALKGNQHKIDKNKNNKIDAHDFKILRGEKKAVKSEAIVRNSDGSMSVLNTRNRTADGKPTVKPYKPTPPEKTKNEKVEEGNNPFDYKNYTSQIPKKPGETAGFDSKKVSTGTVYNRKPVKDEKGEKPKNEEVQQIDELKKATVKSYIAKKMASLPGKNPKKDQESLMRAHSRVTGVKPTSEEVEQVDEMMSTFSNSKSAVKVKPDNSTQVDNALNKTKMDVYFAQRRAENEKNRPKPKNEEVELDEASYSTKSAAAGKDIGKPGKMFGKIASSAAKRYGSEERGKKVAGAILKKLRMKEDVDLLDEEVEDLLNLHEREMTPAETKEKERIVKGMKKSLKGFKQRYGGRAKSVMYATATKQAMKEESIEEGKRPESDTVPFVTGANTTSSPLKRVKEVAGAAMKKVSSDLKAK